jgi:hypothetical protein
MFRQKVQTRRFSFTPYYYQEPEEDEDAPRIRFRRVRRFERPARKPVLGLVVIVVILLWMLFYFTDVKESSRAIQMEDIRVEEVIVN